MEFDLKNKTVVITGGAEGIGYCIAEEFVKESAKVIIVDINEIKGKEAVENLKNKVEFIKYDLTNNPEAVFDEIAEKYKRIHVLVNNAGIADFDFRSAIDLNITATIALSLKFCEHVSYGGGTIINISSIYGFRTGPYAPVYRATKSAVLSFSRSLGHTQNFEKTGTRVIALCPGFTNTSMTKILLEEGSPVGDDEIAYTRAHVWQDPSYVADAAVKIFKTAPSGSAWLIEGGKLEEIKFQY